MSGHWTYRKQDEHVCDKPKHERIGEKIYPGDVWVCDTCGIEHCVKNVFRGDQRDPLGPGELPTIWWD